MPRSQLLSSYFQFIPNTDKTYILAMPSHKMSEATIAAVIRGLTSSLKVTAHALTVPPEKDFFPTRDGGLTTSPYFSIAKDEYDEKVKPYMPDGIDLGVEILRMLRHDSASHSATLEAHNQRQRAAHIRRATTEFIKRENSVLIPAPLGYSDDFLYFLADRTAKSDFEYKVKQNGAPVGAVQAITDSDCLCIHRQFIANYISARELGALPIATLPHTAKFPEPEVALATPAAAAAASATHHAAAGGSAPSPAFAGASAIATYAAGHARGRK
jgi:hypothetical protein